MSIHPLNGIENQNFIFLTNKKMRTHCGLSCFMSFTITMRQFKLFRVCIHLFICKKNKFSNENVIYKQWV